MNPNGAGQDEIRMDLSLPSGPVCASASAAGIVASAPFFGPLRILMVAGAFPDGGETH